MSDLVSQLQDWIEANKEGMVADLQEVLRIPSLEAAALPGAPFGAANREALDWMLGKAESAGMATTDLDGYCGFAEFGSGPGMVMSLGHLDVVPVGDGWKHEPFGAEIDGGYVYARGACDDKGPTVAMFYAARALKEVVGDPGVRVRSVFGCNEESGFKCVARYMETEEAPTLGVAPDAGWPCIHGEKGICDLVVSLDLPAGDLTLLEVIGGQRPNIVVDFCRARVRVSSAYREAFEGAMADSWDANLSFAWEGDEVVIEGRGKAAHGAMPFSGDNAATRVFRFLKEAAPLAQEEVFESLMWVGHPGGHGLGIAGSDEPSGALTANLGVVSTVGGRLELLVNVRYPVTWTGEAVFSKVETALAKDGLGWSVRMASNSAPLYFPLDHPLVRSVVEVYRAETGDEKAPGTMGGGTYARAVPNCVAIGTSWPGDGVAHETDERILVEGLVKTAKIYARLLLRLCEEAKTLRG